MVYIFLTRNDIYFLSIFLSRSSDQSQVRRLKEEPTMGGKGCRKQTSNDSGLFWLVHIFLHPRYFFHNIQDNGVMVY